MNNFIEKIKQNTYLLQILTLMSGTLMAQVVLFAFIPILTRIYTPEEFGNYSLFFILSTIIGSVSSLRYEQAIMLPKSDRDAQVLLFISALLTIITSFLLSLLLIIFYDFFLDYFNNLSYLIWLLPFSVLITGLVQIFNSYSTRNKFYKKMAGVKVVESITTVGSQGISRYFFALDGLIIGKFLSNIYTLYLLVAYHLKKQTLQLKYFTKRRTKANLKRHENFPKYFTLATFLNSISQNIPILLFTSLFSPAVAGFYALTHRILQAPIQLVASSTRSVFYQKASQMYANKEDIRPLYLSTTKGLIKLFIVPFMLILFFGEDIFSLLFGAEWAISGVIAQITIIWFFFTFINPPVTIMYNILGEQKAQLLFQIMGLITRTIAIYAGFYFFESYFYSIIFFTAVSVVHNLLIFFYIYHVMKTSFTHTSKEQTS
ncbi:MAG: oligosaccharide flippase family protein [Sulfurovaceae bacterium]|nr:oligosaccharide flippase family protein [Sulfurovaceae bacterium]